MDRKSLFVGFLAGLVTAVVMPNIFVTGRTTPRALAQTPTEGFFRHEIAPAASPPAPRVPSPRSEPESPAGRPEPPQLPPDDRSPFNPDEGTSLPTPPPVSPRVQPGEASRRSRPFMPPLPPGATPRYQIAAWGMHATPGYNGAYVIDALTGQVWLFDGEGGVKRLGKVPAE